MTAKMFPVAVIGAGPVGMAAAAELIGRGITPLVFERGASVGASVLEWGHVRVFSPWRYNLAPAALALLEPTGWVAPDADELPTGAEIVSRYLEPLAALPQVAPNLRLGAVVTHIAKHGLDKMSNADRDAAPFEIRWTDAAGDEQISLASAVIDASGTWTTPNPMGVDGLAVPGERAARELITYGIPDATGPDRTSFANKTVLVAGSGHSAINAALGLLALQDDEPDTTIIWALRRTNVDKLLGGGLDDQLPGRGALGLAAKRAIDGGRLQVLAPFAATQIAKVGGGLSVDGTLGAAPITVRVDRAIVATGFRPDLAMLSELRVALDPSVEAPPALAPLIDPNVHSCGSVPPHGVVELTQPEVGLYIVGSKSYGRAPTFLMATGYEQVRSIVAELAGDHIAAREVRLVLPETGVCSTSSLTSGSTSSCCGGPAASTDSCCVADEVAKSEGQAGCGCGSAAAAPVRQAEPA